MDYPTTDALPLASVRTVRSVVAYSLSVTLSGRISVIVSEAELLGFAAVTFRIGARPMWRLNSRPRKRLALRVAPTRAIEAGAGYATCGMTAAATPKPKRR